MILSGPEILARMKAGDIQITPFDEKNLGPNSYNLTLADELVYYDCAVLDPRQDNPTVERKIPEEGRVLTPGRVYLSRTVEHTVTNNLVPIIIGRSSTGRLGLFVHPSAGFGDVGFTGYWTLGLVASQPVKVYPGMKICQIYYQAVAGELTSYQGKYASNTGIQASKLHEEFQNR